MERIPEADQGIVIQEVEKSPVHKVLSLEALRGLAAVIVVIYHFILAFLPRFVPLISRQPVDGSPGIVGSPLFFFLNGHAMVTVFFVLSGYVLALKGLRQDATKNLIETALKRWYRLTPLICVATLFSYLLFAFNAYHFNEAGRLSGSFWFDSIAFLGMSQSDKPPLFMALHDGLYGTIFLNDFVFDTALWTMTTEFWGSLVVLAMALLLAPAKRSWLWLALPLAFLCCIAGYSETSNTHLLSSFLLGFLGVLLRFHILSLSRVTALGLLVAGCYCCGFYYPAGCYEWLSLVPVPVKAMQIIISNAGAFLILAVFATHNCISDRFNGTFSRFLGLISFPLYLMHVLVIASFSSCIYVVGNGSNAAIALAGVVLMAIALPLSWLLGMLDHKWLRLLAAWHPLDRFTKAQAT